MDWTGRVTLSANSPALPAETLDNIADFLSHAPPARMAASTALDIACCRRHGRKVAAGRVAPDADVIGIDIVDLGVGAQKADRGLHVLQRLGKDRLADDAVIDRGHQMAGLGVRRQLRDQGGTVDATPAIA